MPLDSVVGTIVDEQNESVVQWIIPKYVPSSKEDVNYLQSPPFHFSYRSWCLRFYPYGDSQSVGSSAVYLVCENITKQDISLTFWIGFRLSLKENESEPSSELHTFNKNNQIHKKINLFQSSLISNSSNPTDIKIDCMVQEEHAQPKDHDSSFCTSQFSYDFMDLYKSVQKSDVTFKVGGFGLPAHMLILAARSSKFKNMFAHNIRQKTRKVVQLDTYDIFTAQSFLNFIYTGKLERGASCQRDSCLYNMAAEFDVTDLKLKCTQLIEQKMCDAIVCNALELADRYSDSRLKTSAERFLIYNIDKILPTKQWETFITENESLAKEILMKAKGEINP